MSAIYTHSYIYIYIYLVSIRTHEHLIQKLLRGLRQKSIGMGPPARDSSSPLETKGMRHDERVVLRQSKILFKYVHIVDGHT